MGNTGHDTNGNNDCDTAVAKLVKIVWPHDSNAKPKKEKMPPTKAQSRTHKKKTPAEYKTIRTQTRI